MIINQEKKLAEVLEQALRLARAGKEPTRIFELYPEYKDELKALLQAAAVLVKNKEQIVPAEATLQRILNNLPDENEVTAVVDARYSLPSDVAGGFLPRILKINQLLMSKRTYIGAVIAVFVLAVIVGVGWYNFSRTPAGLISLQPLTDATTELVLDLEDMTSLGEEPFSDLDGDLNKIIDLPVDQAAAETAKTESSKESTSAKSTPATSTSAQSVDQNLATEEKSFEAEFSKFQLDEKELEAFTNDGSFQQMDSVLSVIDKM